jgi:hypothetical protein
VALNNAFTAYKFQIPRKQNYRKDIVLLEIPAARHTPVRFRETELLEWEVIRKTEGFS